MRQSSGYIILLLIVVFMAGCGYSYKFVHHDDWEGTYKLIEHNCCGDTATKVRMDLRQANNTGYNWVLFLTSDHSQVISGKAYYRHNKMKFFVNNPDSVNKYFVKNVSVEKEVFTIGYTGESYTIWNTDLKDYPRGKMLFAGINFHFRKE